MDSCDNKGNGDLISILVGLVIVIASSLVLYNQLVPWYAGVMGVAVGLYLALPRRMDRATRALAEAWKNFKNGKYK